jgi:hypothetical protein
MPQGMVTESTALKNDTTSTVLTQVREGKLLISDKDIKIFSKHF